MSARHAVSARHARASVAVLAGALVLCGCGAVGMDPDAGKTPVPLPSPTGTSQPVARENLVHLWPLTVDRGTIECREGDQAVFVDEQGTVYALNGKAEEAGASGIGSIRRESAGGWQVSLGALRSRALGLCPPVQGS